MANLVTDDQAREWLNIGDSLDDNLIATLTSAVSQAVRLHLGRSMNVDAAQVASARYFFPADCWTVNIDDAYEITAVATDDADSGTWATTWSSSDYYALPAGGVGADGQTGWPYTSLRAVESRTFPYAIRPAVKVTAKWGWSAVPDDVEIACLMLVAEMYKARDGGYETFTSDAGFTQIRRNLVVRDLLEPYRTARASGSRFRVG